MAQSIIDLQPWASVNVSRTGVITSYRAIQTLVLLLEDRSIFTSASLAPPLLCRCLAIRAEHGPATTSLELSSLDDFILRGIVAIPADSIPAVFATRLAELLADDGWSTRSASLRVSGSSFEINTHLSFLYL